MIRIIAAAALVVVTGTAITTVRAQTNDKDANVVVVKIVDKSATEYSFEPATVTVKAGDVVRFEQTGATPHNVDFRSGKLAGTVSPFLTAAGETYEVTMDAAGTYDYVCTPHEFMDMKGQIIVQ